MKNISTILNVVLVLAVGFLYYYVFSAKNNSSPVVKTVVGSNSVSQAGNAPIAYVDLDSLNEKIVFIKTKRKELESEQKAIETEWENGYKNLEAQKNNFIKKNGNAITQQMAEEFQTKLYSQQQEIDQRKQNLTQKLSEKSYKVMEDIQKKMKEFLNDYNKEKKYLYILTAGTGLDYMAYKDSTLNITADVVEGMNKKLAEGNK
ncbi:MAG TPA: OmpH family outer membrane protein [Ferruginibacter sp.]|nr:OmpH family outer membrane protein [Ferruginibacter sp.]HRE63755.1 OmpH family outer membrane protein [Ferruginibacter sp.]